MLQHLTAVFSNPITWAVIWYFGLLATVEALWPRREWPRIKGWRLKGGVFFLLGITISSSVPLLWDARLAEHRLIDARGLGDFGGAIAGFFVYELLAYFWHRAMHRSQLLWRWFHQMHHSSERLDVWSAFYFHPLDVAGFSLVTSVALVGVLGLTASAAVAASLAVTACSLFQHTNIKTPRRLGWFVQRPEQHAMHHERGRHQGNYGDIALFDAVFGTFENPEKDTGNAGFFDGASGRMGAMLMGENVFSTLSGRELANFVNRLDVARD